MPKYHARGISVHLGTMPLDKTITPHVVLRKGEVAKRQCEEADKQLRSSRKLDEHNVPLPGDATGFELHWLEDVPFMQVQVESVCDAPAPLQLSTTHDDAYTGSASNTTSIPKALVLHVGLSNKTFVSGFDSKTHLKIDVLFNGQLSGCTLIHTNDIRCGAKSLDQVFAGSRIDYLAERPWVILPPGSTIDGKPRTTCRLISAEDRWGQINQAFLNEAVERGINRYSDSPPTAKLLLSLAKTQMPQQLKYSQDPGSKTFGVIDVIITAGTGKKAISGARYLNRPERLRDACFPLAAGENISEQTRSEEAEEGQNGGAREPLKTYRGFAVTEKDAEVDESDHSDDQPPPKRRAPSSVLAFKACPRLVSTPSSSIVDVVLSTPPPVQYTPHTAFPWTTPRYSEHDSFSPLSEVYSSLSQSIPPIHVQAGSKIQHKTRGSQSFRDSGFSDRSHHGLAYAPLTSQQPYTWYSDPTVEVCQSTKRMFPEEPANTRSFPSPVLQPSRPPHGPFSQMQFSDRPLPLEAFSGLPSKSFCVTPSSLTFRDEKERNDSIDSSQSYFSSSMLGAPPLHNYGTPISSSPGTTAPPLRFPGLSVHAPLSYGMEGLSPYGKGPTYPPLVSNWDIRRLPPTGIFTVPQKPRRAASSSDSKLAKYRHGIEVSRLIVMGRDGATIVDHRWTVSQHVPPVGTKKKQQETSPVTIEHTNPSDDNMQGENPNICPLSKEVVTQLFLPDNYLSHGINIKETHQVDPNRRHSDPALPYLRRHHGGPGEILIRGERTKTSDTHSSLAASEQPKILPCLKINRTGTMGAQRLITTTEMPVESKSSLQTARPHESDQPPSSSMNRALLTTPVGDPRGLMFCSAFSSSPLCSASPSPVPSTLPQLDGAPERRRATSYFTREQAQQLSFPTSNLSGPPDPKKRKAASQSPVKRARAAKSPDTMDNPPLNQDCVIAFAEGRDPSTRQGVLRQVRGERQGVFKEEYVVLAVRFYVPGN